MISFEALFLSLDGGVLLKFTPITIDDWTDKGVGVIIKNKFHGCGKNLTKNI
jgi:hypothetical protein